MSPAPLRVSLAPSFRLKAMLVAAHVVAAVSVLLAVVSPALKVGMLLVIGASAARLRRRAPAESFVLDGGGGLHGIDEQGEPRSLDLAPQTIVLPFLVVLSFRDGTRPHQCVVLPDALHGDQFRALRVWLRWMGKV